MKENFFAKNSRKNLDLKNTIKMQKNAKMLKKQKNKNWRLDTTIGLVQLIFFAKKFFTLNF